jgi:hypothetical protein
LIGAVYEDENTVSDRPNKSTLSETEETLNTIKKRLQLLRKNQLFDVIDRKSTQSLVLRNTNVLVNHKHYRYVKTLWIELGKTRNDVSETERLKYEQHVIKGLRSYAKSALTYAITNNLGYQAHGTYSALSSRASPLVRYYIPRNRQGNLYNSNWQKGAAYCRCRQFA